jgi:4-amino-4-deoxy-L-arabinose transferase-like glycosyltransferase
MTVARALEFLGQKRSIWLVSVLTILLFALTNLPWQLEDYDQAKQAFTSWQMVKSGRFFYQSTPNGKVATKPPLVGWTSALLYEVTRSWDLAWRLPSALSAIGLAWLLWTRANSQFGVLAGVVALGAFSFNLLTPRLASLVRTDMPLALVTFGIALLFYKVIGSGKRWSRGDRWSLFLLLSASTLIKGPIVYAFVLPAMLLFRWRRPENVSPLATGWWPWLASLSIFMVWVVGGIRIVPGFYDEVVLREFVARFGETIHRPQPLYFYSSHLLHKWAPWSLLLIALLVADFRAVRQPATPVAASPPRRRWLAHWPPEIVWLLAWSLGGLLVMSFIPSKRVDRIFPVIAPMCLLLAGLVARQVRREFLARWCAATLVTAVLLASFYAGFRVFAGFRQHRSALAKCARDFRVHAALPGWRYAALRGESEALVIYLDLPSFINDDEAVKRWNAGELDAIVGSERRVRSLMHELGQSGEGALKPLCPGPGGKQQQFAVLTRE